MQTKLQSVLSDTKYVSQQFGGREGRGSFGIWGKVWPKHYLQISSPKKVSKSVKMKSIITKRYSSCPTKVSQHYGKRERWMLCASRPTEGRAFASSDHTILATGK